MPADRAGTTSRAKRCSPTAQPARRLPNRTWVPFSTNETNRICGKALAPRLAPGRPKASALPRASCDVVVTLGYVLIQVQNDQTALRNFATLISSLFPTHSCVLIAVDAYSNRQWRDTFASQCASLRAALNDLDVDFADNTLTFTRSIKLEISILTSQHAEI